MNDDKQKNIIQRSMDFLKEKFTFKPHEKALLKAYARQGLAELRQSFGTFYQEGRSMAEVDQGMWGKATSYEVNMERQAMERQGHDQPKNLLEEEQEKLREQLASEPKQEKELEK